MSTIRMPNCRVVVRGSPLNGSKASSKCLFGGLTTEKGRAPSTVVEKTASYAYGNSNTTSLVPLEGGLLQI